MDVQYADAMYTTQEGKVVLIFPSNPYFETLKQKYPDALLHFNVLAFKLEDFLNVVV